MVRILFFGNGFSDVIVVCKRRQITPPALKMPI